MTSSPAVRLTLLGMVLLTFLAASSAPTPLYASYQQAWGFSTFWLTLVFAVYALALLAALLVGGRLSDHLGRRPVILGALVLEILAMLLFHQAEGLADLVLARTLQGLATGIATSALGAALLDVDAERGPWLNSLTPLLGMAVGALGCGLLVEFAPAPLQLVYRLFLLLFVLQGLLLLRLPIACHAGRGCSPPCVRNWRSRRRRAPCCGGSCRWSWRYGRWAVSICR